MILTPSANLPADAATPRLNLIFHGLMAFRDAGTQHYDVMIPQPGASCHEAKYGNPLDTPKAPLDSLKDFPKQRSYFYIEGVRDGGYTAARPNSSNAVILRNELLVPQPKGVRTVIRVPKPDIIRLYRGAETHGVELCGDEASRPVLIKPPDMVFEVTVFSYFFFSNPALVGGDAPYKIPQFQNKYWNLCVYSQPLAPCPASDSALFGSMFNVKNTGSPLNVNLALQSAVADGAPQTTSIGITNTELLALKELPGVITVETSVPGGCGSGFVCDGDGPPPAP
jgi:hypothetical protein